MKAMVILCREAKPQMGGTACMIDGGLGYAFVSDQPFTATLFIRIEAETAKDAGHHTYALEAVDDDGKPVVPKTGELRFGISVFPAFYGFTLGFNFVPQRAGTVLITLWVNRKPAADWTLKVLEPGSKDTKK